MVSKVEKIQPIIYSSQSLLMLGMQTIPLHPLWGHRMSLITVCLPITMVGRKIPLQSRWAMPISLFLTLKNIRKHQTSVLILVKGCQQQPSHLIKLMWFKVSGSFLELLITLIFHYPMCILKIKVVLMTRAPSIPGMVPGAMSVHLSSHGKDIFLNPAVPRS